MGNQKKISVANRIADFEVIRLELCIGEINVRIRGYYARGSQLIV